jgi:membrane protease YdiL (CAAX protease family)
MELVSSRLENRAFWLFLVLAFGIAVPCFVLTTRGAPALLQLALLIAGSYAPALAAGVTIFIHRDRRAWEQLSARIRRVRAPAKLYWVALLLPALVWLVALVLANLLDFPRQTQWTTMLAFPLIFATNFGEEIGWRGFALPHLMKRYNPLVASLILGLIWGIFHMPLYLHEPVMAVLELALIGAVSVILAWLFLGSRGSLVLCTLFHAGLNTWGQMILPVQGGFMIFAVVVFLLWVIVGFLVARNGSRLVATKNI